MAVDGIKSLSDPESLANIKRYVSEFLNKNQFTVDNPAYDGNPILAYKHHVQRVTEALASTKGASFIAIQTALKALNPGPVGTGKIYNPAAAYGPPPFAGSTLTDAADIGAASRNPGSELSVRLDTLKLEALRIQKEYQQKNINLFDSENKATENYYIDTEQPDSASAPGTLRETVLPGIEVSKPDLSVMFEQKNLGFDFGTGEKGYKRWQPKIGARKIRSASKAAQQKHFENQDSFFHFAELEKGYITDEQFTEPGIEDSTNYLPFFLEDMRSGGKRIYFRAFFKNLRETIAPSWSQEQYFGRVDPVGVYMGTSRQISVSFAMVAFSPEGFTVMWRKLNQFAKLVYPTFNEGVMVKSPTARLRIGDVVCDWFGSGLTGYISSPIELDYSNSTWEIQQWTGFDGQRELGKAPQMAIVSFTFQVIHEFTPKLDIDFNFDTSNFRRIGTLNEGPTEEIEEDVGEESTGEDGST